MRRLFRSALSGMGLLSMALSPVCIALAQDTVTNAAADAAATATPASAPQAAAKAQASPIPVKVVVVTMFEIGKDTGDLPGEFQLWAEREHLTHRYLMPDAYHDAMMNDDGVLGIVTGMGTIRAAASIMALGNDPRFDLSHAYWLVAGIAGIKPEMGTLGDAVWSDWIVDGDLAHEVDLREAPPDWKTGYVPLRKSKPYEEPRTEDNGMAFVLNPKLVGWAYDLTKSMKLADNADLAERRMQYPGQAAHSSASVLRGDNLSASTFWHGRKMSEWATGWVRYQTNGKGQYAVTGMEDSGTLQSLTWLGRAGKADASRVMVLRTASNFDQQPIGKNAAESLGETKITKYSAYPIAIQNAYLVGDAVVRELVKNWPKYKDETPAPQTRE